VVGVEVVAGEVAGEEAEGEVMEVVGMVEKMEEVVEVEYKVYLVKKSVIRKIQMIMKN
jgi:hypothetical protein